MIRGCAGWLVILVYAKKIEQKLEATSCTVKGCSQGLLKRDFGAFKGYQKRPAGNAIGSQRGKNEMMRIRRDQLAAAPAGSLGAFSRVALGASQRSSQSRT